MKKSLALLLAVCSLVTLLSGCGNKQTTDDSSTPSEQPAQTEAKDTVVVALSGNPVTLDPMMTNNGSCCWI